MMSAIADDLATVFSTNDFAENATYSPTGGLSCEVVGLFDDEDIESGDGSHSTSIVTQTTFHCKSADVSGIKENDEFVIRNTTYYVANTKDDGTGTVIVYLSTGAV